MQAGVKTTPEELVAYVQEHAEAYLQCIKNIPLEYYWSVLKRNLACNAS